MRFKLMHGAPPLPRRPVIKLNDYNKLKENDGLFIHRWMLQRCEFYDSIQVSDCLLIIILVVICVVMYGVKISFVQNL